VLISVSFRVLVLGLWSVLPSREWLWIAPIWTYQFLCVRTSDRRSEPNTVLNTNIWLVCQIHMLHWTETSYDLLLNRKSIWSIQNLLHYSQRFFLKAADTWFNIRQLKTNQKQQQQQCVYEKDCNRLTTNVMLCWCTSDKWIIVHITMSLLLYWISIFNFNTQIFTFQICIAFTGAQIDIMNISERTKNSNSFNICLVRPCLSSFIILTHLYYKNNR